MFSYISACLVEGTVHSAACLSKNKFTHMHNRHNKRAYWHNYYSRSIYLITLNKRPEAPVLGTLGGDWYILPGGSNSPFIRFSEVGNLVRSKIKMLPDIIPNSQLMQYIVMPDHIHVLILIILLNIYALINLIPRGNRLATN